MQFGVAVFPTEDTPRPGALARAVEERGFESLWVAEHSHIPASRATPWPGGAELPRSTTDCSTRSSRWPARRRRRRRSSSAPGSASSSSATRSRPRRQVATLDLLSGGRFLFGIGGGWNREEMANHGTAYGARWKLLRERIEAMKAIWTSRRGRATAARPSTFDRIFAGRSRVQKPHPPIHVGGAFPGGMRRALRYGDGWMPIRGRGDDDVAKHMAAFREAALEAGRDPASMEVTLYACPPDADLIDRCEEAGVTRLVFRLPNEGKDGALRFLDRIRALCGT